MKLSSLLAALPLLAAASVEAQVCIELIENGGFENGSGNVFTGWTNNDSLNCFTVRNDGGEDPNGPGGVTAPIQGSSDALAFQSFAGGICSISQTAPQTGAIPPGSIVSATLSWQDRIRNYLNTERPGCEPTCFIDPDNEARVMFGDDVVGLQKVWSTQPSDPSIQFGPNLRSVDVTGVVQSAQAQGNPITVQLVLQPDYLINVNWDAVSLQVCYSEDEDGDGVLDEDDECPGTDPLDPINEVGCSPSQSCPCDGDQWKNHGQYVKCDVHAANDLFLLGVINEEEKDAIVSAAGQSECGKNNPVRRQLRG